MLRNPLKKNERVFLIRVMNRRIGNGGDDKVIDNFGMAGVYENGKRLREIMCKKLNDDG